VSKITVKQGLYKMDGQLHTVSGQTFHLVADYQEDHLGGYVTVDGSTCEGGSLTFPARDIKIRVANRSSYVIDSPPPNKKQELPHMSDEEIIARTRERFEILDEMTKAVKAGTVRAMIVSGPPGVGKSFGVETVLRKDDLFDQLGNRKPKYEVVKGTLSAVGLYKKLYEFSRKGNILVFDDCDVIFTDELSLNIMKAALDTSKKRTISWNTDSRLLRQEDVPSSFEFSGGCIFITNLKFANVRSKKLQDHLAALESRCHYIDLQMDTMRERLLRIRQIVDDGMLKDYEFEDGVADEIIDFIFGNKHKMRELSLRTVLKVADLRKSFPNTWRSMAAVTIMKN
jgi:hypothetical protein